jgi:hypothetical protein
MPMRKELLETAIKLTCGDRQEQYGDPLDNLLNTATLFQAYLEAKMGSRSLGYGPNQYALSAEDVAWLNVLQKIARTMTGVPKPDTYIDAAAYAAIAGECHEEEKYL